MQITSLILQFGLRTKSDLFYQVTQWIQCYVMMELIIKFIVYLYYHFFEDMV